MKRLEITFNVTRASYHYAKKTWPDAEFETNEEHKGVLTLWEDDVLPNQIPEAAKRLQNRFNSFRLAIKYMDNPNIAFERTSPIMYYFEEKKFQAEAPEEISSIIDFLSGKAAKYEPCRHCHLSFHVEIRDVIAKLPQEMPAISADLERLAEMIIAAQEVWKYPDVCLRLAFIFLEEFRNELNPDEFERLGVIRDFVSHRSCNNSAVVRLISAELPSAKVKRREVRFDRNKPDHMAFIRDAARAAFFRAKEIFRKKVLENGGSIPDHPA